MDASFFDNLTAITSNIEEISFIKYAIITEVNDDNTVNCREKENETIHQDVLCLNKLNSVDDTILLGFVDNDVYNPIVIGNLNQKGGMVSNYNDLSGLPQINGVVLKDNKSLSDLGIGSKLSDFVNDVGFITSDYHDDSKVDKVEGKQLSSNDFTNSEKSKLAILENYDDSEIREILENKADNVHSHSINDITNLTSQLNTKVDKVNGKGLSTVDFTDTNYVHTDNNFTTSEKNKLSNLENYDDTEVKSDIQNLKTNKQNKLSAGSNITIVDDVISAVGGGTAQVQSDYAQTDSTQVDYIKNKPDIRQMVIDVLNEKFDGMISNATVENGKLKVNRFNNGDFDD